ncbi:MAG: hypothetical protein R3D03_20810 [Geminicoccaceae bacterium]
MVYRIERFPEPPANEPPALPAVLVSDQKTGIGKQSSMFIA